MIREFTISSGVGNDGEGHQLRSPITVFHAETERNPSPQLNVQETIRGTLTAGLTSEELFHFKFKSDVQVGFEGRGYTFSRLEKDGAFELSTIVV
jgi:hypothetical protein